MTKPILRHDLPLGDAVAVVHRSHDDRHVRRVLFVSYAFPPTGGGGVQRSVKFVKYLPQFNWRPTVLTASNPSVPVTDQDLNGEVDREVNVLRARTWEPGYRWKASLGGSSAKSNRPSWRSIVRKAGMWLLQPDPQVLWNPSAFWAASKELRREAYDAIYVTGPPFSSFLLGRALKRRFGLPLVVDFRDEWLLASEHLDNYSFGRAARGRQLRMMQSVLRASDAVITTTQASAGEIRGHANHCGARPIIRCIYNGFDPPDFGTSSTHREATDRLRIIYTGTLWKLTDIQPLVTALQRVAATAEIAARRIELVLVGRRTPMQDSVVRQLDPTPVTVRSHDYLPHREAIDEARRGDVLLLLLANQRGAERVVPAKLFEYMALGKPILAICPEGETDELLAKHGYPHRFAPNQTDQIANWILARIPAGITESEPTTLLDRSVIETFSRKNLTHQLSDLLSEVSRTRVTPHARSSREVRLAS